MRQLISSLMCFGLIGCAGNAPSTPGGDDAPEVDAGVDAPPAPVGVKLTGKTMDYFSLTPTPMDLVALATDGIQPQMTVTSATGGLYELDGVPAGSKVYFTASRTNYRPTRNPPVTTADMPVMQDFYVATIADINRQYATAGKPVGAGKAFLAIDLKRNNGMPLDGVTTADITLVDAQNAVVPGLTANTYFFGADGNIDLAATASATFNGKARAMILDVPPGSYTLKVTYPNGQGGTQTNTTAVSFAADGATLAISGGMMGGGGGTMITNPKFTTDIYPKLQKASAGGLGCANCHTLGGPGAVLKYDDPAATTLANMKARIGVLDLTTPALSLFLTKPLYEPAPYNHPNATFVDINDNDYKLFLKWIQQGALE